MYRNIFRCAIKNCETRRVLFSGLVSYVSGREKNVQQRKKNTFTKRMNLIFLSSINNRIHERIDFAVPQKFITDLKFRLH